MSCLGRGSVPVVAHVLPLVGQGHAQPLPEGKWPAKVGVNHLCPLVWLAVTVAPQDDIFARRARGVRVIVDPFLLRPREPISSHNPQRVI